MPTKIRLQRHGKKAAAFYHIIIADSRSPRDGKLIERIGSYNPNTNPATIELDFNKALTWVQKGAQPTNTCRAILSYKGVMHKDHLLRGVAKGALTNEQVEAKFEKWMGDKEGKITGKKEKLSSNKAAENKKRLAAEAVANEAKAKAIIAKNTPVEEPAVEEAGNAALEQEQTSGETPAE